MIYDLSRIDLNEELTTQLKEQYKLNVKKLLKIYIRLK